MEVPYYHYAVYCFQLSNFLTRSMHSSLVIRSLPFSTLRNSKKLTGQFESFPIIRSFDIFGGKCSIVTIPDVDISPGILQHDYGFSMGEFEAATKRTSRISVNSFLAGRVALRHSIDSITPELSHKIPCISSNIHGAPVFPSDLKGTVSHKDNCAVGLVLLREHSEIGVDIERYKRKDTDYKIPIGRILTKQEQDRIGNMKDFTKEEEVLLRFSLKESLYKALHPYVKRFIGLRSVEIDPTDIGTGIIRFVEEDEASAAGAEGSTTTKIDENDTLVINGVSYRYITYWEKICDQYCITAVKICHSPPVPDENNVLQ